MIHTLTESEKSRKLGDAVRSIDTRNRISQFSTSTISHYIQNTALWETAESTASACEFLNTATRPRRWAVEEYLEWFFF